MQNAYGWLKRFRTPLAISLYLCLLVVGCTKPQPPSNTDAKPEVTSIGVVKATPRETKVDRGQSAEANVRLEIKNGYHLNANPPTFSYLIPAQLNVSPAAGITIDSVTYPNAVTKKFSFADQPLAVYEGEIDLKVRLSAAKSTPVGVHNLSAKLRVQACDDQVCYAPGTIDLTLPVNVK